MSKEKYHKYRSQGLCGHCGKTCFMNYSVCEYHYRLRRKADAKYYISNKERLDAKRNHSRRLFKKNNICVDCNRNELFSSTRCRTCLLKNNEERKIARRLQSMHNMSHVNMCILIRNLVTE